MPLPSAYNPKEYEYQIYQDWLKLKLGSPEVQEELQATPKPSVSPLRATMSVEASSTCTSLLTRGIDNVNFSEGTSSVPLQHENGDVVADSTDTYSIVVPPPNLTGDLHMGHAFEHYLMDTLVRIARQEGKPTLYYPGVDHAGIQLEGVINKLINRGDFDEEIKENSFLVNEAGESVFIFFEIAKEDRANFLKQNFPDLWLKLAWSKVQVWRGNQLKQAEKLGDSPDFDRLLFTLDKRAVDMVNYAFIKYWQDGLIHKGSYLINWSVALQTALSDVPEDISHEERKDPFVTFEYRVSGHGIEEFNGDLEQSDLQIFWNKISDKISNSKILVGTVRPETIFGDVAVAVHPNKIKSIFNLSEEEASKLVQLLNKKTGGIKINLMNSALGIEKIPLIVDESVEENFGTGALKITPASDIVDYNIAAKHGINHLPQAIGRDGKLTSICGEFAGLTVEQGRMAVIKRLIEDGFVPTKEGFEENRETVQNKPSVEKLSDLAFRELSLEKQKEYLQKNYPQYQVDWNYVHNVTICERSKTVVEPLISEEFFVDYYAKFKYNPKQNVKKQAANVPLERGETAGFGVAHNQNSPQNGDREVSATPTIGQETTLQQLAIAGIHQTNFFPEDYKERALNYFETIKNWCISRDLIWGHKMPVWYNLDTNPEKIFFSYERYNKTEVGDYAGNIIDRKTGEDRSVFVKEMFKVQVEKPTEPGNWVQETKILDTWFSSTLWPLTTLNYLDFANGKQDTDFEKFYPTQTMTTAKEIFYAWIVRMIMTGMYFAGQTPFENYLAHAWVLDDKGKKMSKSLGNVVDVADQIEKYSSDAVRLGMLEKSIPGRNIRFGGKLGDAASEKYRNFGNKLWNVARFLEGKEGEVK
jgi:valyl-tRNA synthetase